MPERVGREEPPDQQFRIGAELRRSVLSKIKPGKLAAPVSGAARHLIATGSLGKR